MYLKVCEAWGIPFLSMDGVEAQSIPQLVENMEPKPRVILCTISTISDPAIQKHIRRLPIRTICLDEVQVFLQWKLLRINALAGASIFNICSKGDKLWWQDWLGWFFAFLVQIYAHYSCLQKSSHQAIVLGLLQSSFPCRDLLPCISHSYRRCCQRHSKYAKNIMQSGHRGSEDYWPPFYRWNIKDYRLNYQLYGKLLTI